MRKELFSEKVIAGGRTYFFDVKESQEGKRYLVISESRIGHEHSRIMIFEENMESFLTGLDKVVEFWGLAGQPTSYNVDEIRQQHARAYEKWTLAEDDELVEKYTEGADLAELAAFFQRQPGAIQSRLAKFGLSL